MGRYYFVATLTAVAMLYGCATPEKSAPPEKTLIPTEQPAAEPAEERVVETAPIDVSSRLKSAIDAMQVGDLERARVDLEAILALKPGHKVAGSLHAQLTDDPQQRLGTAYFDYTTVTGDSLSLIAKRFLGDPLLFVILARYNEIDNPSQLTVGEQLKIPGSRPADTATGETAATEPAASPASVPATPAEPEAAAEAVEQEKADVTSDAAQAGEPAEVATTQAVPASVLDEREQAERFYRQGLTLSASGDEERAYEAFTQALVYDPGHAGASAQQGTLRESIVDRNHKQAMLLYRRQQLTEAIELWDKVLELDPTHESAQIYRARAIELKNRMDALKS